MRPSATRVVAIRALSKADKMRLNGWQRIGVVLTALWLVGFGAPYLLSSLRDADRSASNALRLCLDYSDKYEDCSSRYEETIGDYQRVELATWAIVVLAPVPLAWLLAFGGVWTTRWVRRGFQQSG